jgi:hypothetical protein
MPSNNLYRFYYEKFRKKSNKKKWYFHYLSNII